MRKKLKGLLKLIKNIIYIGLIYLTIEWIGFIKVMFFNNTYSIDLYHSLSTQYRLILIPVIFILICYQTKKVFDSNLFTKSSTSKIEIKKYSLTEREYKVLELILTGKSNTQIQDELYIAKSTLKTHINHIFNKVKVKTRLELIFLFLEKKAFTEDEKQID